MFVWGLTFYIWLFILRVTVYVIVHTCPSLDVLIEVREQLVEVSSFLLPCGCRGSNLGHQGLEASVFTC